MVATLSGNSLRPSSPHAQNGFVVKENGFVGFRPRNRLAAIRPWLSSRHQALVKVIEFNDRDPRRIQEAIEAGLGRCSRKSTFCFWKHFGKACLNGARPVPTAARGSLATRRTSPSGFPQSHSYRELDGRLARRTPAPGCPLGIQPS
jgi:hypothetical protein